MAQTNGDGAPPPLRRASALGSTIRKAHSEQIFSASPPGRVKTKSDLVVIPCGAGIFAFFRSPCGHMPQNSWCIFTAQSFHTACPPIADITAGTEPNNGCFPTRRAVPGIKMDLPPLADDRCRLRLVIKNSRLEIFTCRFWSGAPAGALLH